MDPRLHPAGVASDSAVTPIRHRFVPPGTVADPAAPDEIWLDVGNRLGDGVFDHHQPRAPARCTAALVLAGAEAIRARVADLPPGAPLTLVTHTDPDTDAVTAAWLVERLLAGDLPRPAADTWAEAVCAIDRGETRLDPVDPITPYAAMLARLYLAGLESESESESDSGSESGEAVAVATPDTGSVSTPGARDDRHDRARAALAGGMELVAWLVTRLDQGVGLDRLGEAIAAAPELAPEIALIRADHAAYLRDRARAETLTLAIPRADGTGSERVPGLWLEAPESLLFKAWARGDTQGARDPRGFVFTAVLLPPARAILSVQPGLGLWLRGLGEALERAETRERQRQGCPRTGPPRPGYGGPDPWYDGRSPLHGYTIVDAPHGGSVLSPAEIRDVLNAWLADVGKSPRSTGN